MIWAEVIWGLIALILVLDARRIHGRLAMLGLAIGTINYVLFGAIAPGFF